MKRKPTMLIAYCLLFLTFIGCKKDDDGDMSQNPIDQLPPLTQTGENTFGCLLDGKPFLPGNGGNPLDCVYQFVNGGYYFALQANREIDLNLIRLGCNTQNLEINQDGVYVLKENISGNASGKYFFETHLNYTSNTHTGELTITKLDFDNHIVSGTFWYDVEDHNGIVHEIREGRFDMLFSQ